VNGFERAFDFTTGLPLPGDLDVFAPLRTKYTGNTAALLEIDPVAQPNRFENRGFGMALSVLYQFRLETIFDETGADRLQETELSMADVILYAGMLAIARCGGPHIEFQPGRLDANGPDAPQRLPNAIEPVHHTVSYFWTNGVTSFDMVNLLAAHTTACFGVGCLDRTPAVQDSDWAALVRSITGPSHPSICPFTALGAPVPGPPRNVCLLPADAVLNTRSDIRRYLNAIQLPGNTPTQIHLAADNINYANTPALRCQARIGCTTRTAGVAPFRLLTVQPSTSINLCYREGLTMYNCPADAVANFQNSIATSWFKMSKWYAGADGTNQGLPWGVKPQPCQPGTIKIGALVPEGADEPISDRCTCCPNPIPQDWNWVPADGGVAAQGVQTASVVTEAGLVAAAMQPAITATTADVEPAIATSAVAAVPVLEAGGHAAVTAPQPSNTYERIWAGLTG
jgi:hypothetical protein